MTQKKQRVLITVLILIGMSVLFLFPTMMAFNIALQRPMVLGRYSLGRGIAMIIATLAAIGVLLGLWIPRKAKTPEQKRQTVFKIIALTVSILLALVFVDVAMRMTETPRYLRDGPRRSDRFRGCRSPAGSPYAPSRALCRLLPPVKTGG